MASAADIIVNLVAKTARFERGIDRANKHLAVMSKAARTAQFVMRTLGTAIVGLGVGRVAGAIRQQLTFAGNLQRVAEVVGFTTSQIQSLRFAAEQLNLTQQSLDLGLQRFSRRIAEAAQGQGELIKVAAQYGIQLRDQEGRLRPNIELLKDLADVVAGAKDEQEQLRIAFKAFDTEGAALVRLLRGGSEAVEEFQRRAHSLGLVVDDAMISKAADADRQLTQLSSVLQARVLVAVANNVEGITGMANAVGFLAEKTVQLTADLVDLAKKGGRAFLENDEAIRIGLLVEDINKLQEKINEPVSNGGLLNVLKNGIFAPLVARDDLALARVELAKLQAEFERFLQESADDALQRAAALRRDIKSTGSAAAISLKVDRSGVDEIDLTEVLIRHNTILSERKHLQQLIAKTTLEEQRILEDIRFINRLLVEGGHDENELLKVRKGLFEDLQKALDKGLDSTQRLTEVGVQTVRNLQDAMSEFLQSTDQGFDDLLGNFVNLLRRMVAELLARQILLSFLGFLAKGSGGLASFATKVLGQIEKRHSGGPVTKGQPYIVGRPGAEEMFIPNQSGRIAAGVGGVNVSLYQTNEFNGSTTSPEQMIPLLEANNVKLKAELLDELDREQYR